MGNGRIPQERGNIGNTYPLFIQKIFSVLHPLALEKIKDGSTVHFFESFFQITFINSNLTAQSLYGKGLADMLQQDLPRFRYLLPVCLICQEFAGKGIFTFPCHALHAV